MKEHWKLFFSIDQDKLNFSECYDATVFIHYDVTDSMISIYCGVTILSIFYEGTYLFNPNPLFFNSEKV